ncbi:MAG TPA: metal-sulfur cluster assembly factor [Chloroflexota bacterium]|jgi:metal-sulfur cluster biosynthetic enzyme|nr:metal-sulfur cluster assembly factor [Chloroflexota bacterium]
MIDNEALMSALKNVYDPELGLNVVDLGLVYGIEQQDGNIAVDMTLTTPGCPLHESMLTGVGEALSIFPGVKRIEVRLVWEPLWTPDRISEEGRQSLGWAA